MPCLGLPKPEVIRSALEVRRKYFVPLVPIIPLDFKFILYLV